MTPTTEPTTLLTTEDKLTIVNQHIRSIDYTIYGLELDILVENAATNPDAKDWQTTIANLMC